MTERDQSLLEIRLKIEVETNSKTIESFQNETLRPILKFQNELIISIYKNLLVKRKKNFERMDLADKLLFISKSMKEDTHYKDIITGIILGHFTEEEYAFFFDNDTEISRRIITMTIQRLQSQVDIL